MTAIGPLDVHLADESGVGLVHQAGRLERVIGALVHHSLLRDGSDDQVLVAALRDIWLGRRDRYSEVREPVEKPLVNKVEMYRMGG